MEQAGSNKDCLHYTVKPLNNRRKSSVICRQVVPFLEVALQATPINLEVIYHCETLKGVASQRLSQQHAASTDTRSGLHLENFLKGGKKRRMPIQEGAKIFADITGTLLL